MNSNYFIYLYIISMAANILILMDLTISEQSLVKYGIPENKQIMLAIYTTRITNNSKNLSMWLLMDILALCISLHSSQLKVHAIKIRVVDKHISQCNQYLLCNNNNTKSKCHIE